MSKVLTRLDKIIILCKNAQKTAGVYAQALGLKVHLQSDRYVQLRDSFNMAICLQQTLKPSHLAKGYSPMLSLYVQNFDQVYNRLLRCQLMQDGQVIRTDKGKMATFLGPEGEMLSIHNMQQQQQVQQEVLGGDDQIKRLLEKIKM